MSDAEHERRQMGRRHIFAINDSPEFLDMVRAILQGARYNVTTTNYVPRTFDQIAALQPDVLLVDLVFGQRAGWDLLERLHAEARTRGIPVLAFSTDRRLLAMAQADPARYGVDAFLPKPFDLDDLIDAVERLCGGAGAGGARSTEGH